MDIIDELIRQQGERFDYAREIHRPFHGLEPVLDWCKSECSPDWRWQLVDTPGDIRDGRYIFYFNNQQDYTNFLLKWG